MSYKAKQEERADVVRSLNALSETVQSENRNFTEEEKVEYDKLDTLQRSLKDEIETLDRIERSKSLVTPEHNQTVEYRPQTISPEERNLVFRAWAFSASGHDKYITSDMRKSAERLGFNLQQKSIYRTGQTIGTSTAGAELANGSVFGGIEHALKAYGGMRSVARVKKTDQGNPLVFAFNDDTANKGAIIGENTNTASTDLVYSKVTLGAYRYSSGVYPVSIELLQDSGIDLAADVGEQLGIRLARIQNDHFTTGTGSGQPTGVVAGATQGGSTTASTTAVTYGELNKLYHSVDPLYRNDPSCSWMMSDNTWSKLKEITDQNGRPLLNSSLDGVSAGFEERLMGKPVVINNSMAAMTAANKPILFGAFNRYLIRDVLDTRIQVFNELYGLDGSVAFVAFSRNDGASLNSGAIKYLLMHA